VRNYGDVDGVLPSEMKHDVGNYDVSSVEYRATCHGDGAL
jgi:hypothetical protein